MSQGRNRIQMVRHEIEGAVDLTLRRRWFADEGAQTPAGDSSSAAQPDAAAEMPDWAKDPKRALEIVKELRDENAKTRTSARELEKRLEAIEKARQQADEQKLVEQNEWKTIAEKRAEELAKLQETLQKSQVQALRAQIAAELGLPAALAARLQGATEEELRADGEQLKAAIPAAPGAPKPNTTQAVPGGSPAQETDEQRRTRLRGGSGSVLGRRG